MQKTILSGVKPTGRPHIGNYFGAMRQFVELQNEYQSYFMIADYHALNLIQNAKEMRELSLDVAIDFLAIGLNPKKSIIFKQSDVPEHTELAWIFDTITTVPYLKRAHAYKDAMAKGGEEDVSAGTFTYPMLMAADILLYDTDVVPVGQDQKQHIEFARDTAEKFNRIFSGSTSLTTGEIFKLPEALIIKDVETVPGTDGRKMSKSYNNTIPLFASDEEIEKAVMSIVTDSKAEYPENVFYIHKLFRSVAELDKIYEENKGKYKVLKDILIEDLKNFIRPLRERREEIAKDLNFVQKVLAEGKERARAKASQKMIAVKRAIGVI
ncbi:MAG: tryptophan--tRNA ligase [Candidatus Zambryskibacteria bacterium RIFCSPLOWO2_01_FULL_39_39]|uniref:Tryptophan--tRNA ligase n=1 Tax=Candidatus Zambryskibacteria bacterium RIFCSPLOWO2_01_FULL_39_39 TaxID=1802758 RepID=A0A1G2TYY4_9BACT|nr:MAG: Tryptophan-tRNA ligase [Parcubacteria group bacterium GW2011_GWA1_38_7]OHA87461.1 MAG: tryptophan--tRNA ligase [Candidatus Zambryskibacteria bacterium RIFCSPHIGHO2_01_FULL_39_63]OHA94899.1 MAG: tryptophan--tRNA ligase [Candidatus Zambryskibacteria bacterium RIFCSPHIGHO2_02_FULL_39_19]OHA99079.1 MAG: tryptophan--tRNA ligase [Candidatus Zambryskibacteria bacterium RIFCSPHIGHO2_12_FULL_39_21]OHB01840.1 MAG: tryptophan--tRNA ligase [Candidatus Zambryskibacteria bacterium RIFCSPLOWO2_01_FULL